MHLPSESKLLRIFVGENDKYNNTPLYEAIVKEARRLGMAGATVIRGILGFGASSRIHYPKVLRLSEELPVIIEIIDLPERIDNFLPVLDIMMKGGLVTIEPVQVVSYRPSESEIP
jgi:PII-like signaling protein